MLGGLETSDVLKINVVDKKYKVNRKWKYLSTSTPKLYSASVNVLSFHH